MKAFIIDLYGKKEVGHISEMPALKYTTMKHEFNTTRPLYLRYGTFYLPVLNSKYEKPLWIAKP